MKSLSLSKIMAATAVGLVLQTQTANAFTVPTLDMTMIAEAIQTATDHGIELGEIGTQIQKGIELSKTSGSPLSLEAGLKVGEAIGAEQLSKIKYTEKQEAKMKEAMKKLGLPESAYKDPAQLNTALNAIHDKAKGGNFTAEERKLCMTTMGKMQQDLTDAALVESMAVLSKEMRGKDMKQVVKTTVSGKDLTQQEQAKLTQNQLIYVALAKASKTEANKMAATAVSALCD
ncbi:MAG TPA: hypothetical protein DCX19_01220 [Alphaproteobacteria bacterium]|nr:hypothetical protein [Alphaproteobacteria bacterium]